MTKSMSTSKTFLSQALGSYHRAASGARLHIGWSDNVDRLPVDYLFAKQPTGHVGVVKV